MSAKVDIKSEGQTFIRFARSQRLEHIVLIVTFTLMGFTGLIQKFNQNPIANNAIMALGGIENVRLIHRTVAIILVIEALVHVCALGYRFITKRIAPSMIPTIGDVKDAWQMVLYFFGRRKERPLFDTFDFRQKFEYWSLVWGVLIMALTGFAMWFPIQTAHLFSGQVIVAAKTAHGAEAILAVLAILLWHMYSAHLNADIFPMDKAIFNGKVSRERMVHEHPLQYARLMEEAKAAEGETDVTAS
jgi:formate dehydrogenase subunit gamma